MTVHFEVGELAARRSKTVDKMAAAGLDGLLMSRSELDLFVVT